MDVRIRAVATAAITMAAMVTLPKAVSAQNNRYQTEVSLGYLWTETDSTPTITQTEIPLRGTYHFEPVSLKGHPWNEADFLEHSMSASLELRWYDFDVSGSGADGLLYGGGFRYAEKEKPIAAEFNFRTGSIDGSGIDIDVTSLDLSVGYWVKDNAIAGFAYQRDELDAGGGFNYEKQTFSGFGKLVHKLDDEQSVNGEARIGWASVDTGTTDTNMEISLAGDFYFTPQYSAGAMLDFSFGDAVSDEGTTLGLRGSAWFNQQVGARVEYSRFLASDSAGVDDDSFAIYVAVRF